MTSTSFQPLSPEQAWITAEGACLYGKEAEQYLQASIRSMNRICRSAQRLMRGIECELKQRNQTSNMTLYAINTDEMLARIVIYCEMFLDEYEELQETQP